MSTNYHYKAYHARLHSLSDEVPAIPLISVVCAELFNTNDAMSNRADTGPDWINWDKMQVVGDRMHEIKRFGHIHYNLMEVSPIRDAITKAEVWQDEDIAYEIAAIREKAPRDDLKHTTTSDLWEGRELSDRDWLLFLTGTRPLQFQLNDVVLERGQLNAHLYRIHSGTVRVEILPPGETTPVVVARMGAGEIFGEISLVLRDVQGATTASIVADSACEIFRLEIDFVLEICRTQPATSAALHIFLAKKLAARLKGLKPKSKSTPTSASASLAESETDTAASDVRHMFPCSETDRGLGYRG